MRLADYKATLQASLAAGGISPDLKLLLDSILERWRAATPLARNLVDLVVELHQQRQSLS